MQMPFPQLIQDAKMRGYYAASCGDEIAEVARSGCDTFVTADLKYHLFLQAKFQVLITSHIMQTVK